MSRTCPKASTRTITKSSIVTLACTLTISLFGLPTGSHALLIDTGINTGYMQLGTNGTNGATGAGGAGGTGGAGGAHGLQGSVGLDGQAGNIGGTGGDGGNGNWFIGGSIANMGVINLGGTAGTGGYSGSQGSNRQTNGRGGSGGGLLAGSATAGSGIYGGSRGTFSSSDGKAGTNGSGGGGGYAFGSGGRGGNGADGNGGTGTNGTNGTTENQTTATSFTNGISGTIQVGGTGGNGGNGGNGGSGGGGGGGGGGIITNFLGGKGGTGGAGGAGSIGGTAGTGNIYIQNSGLLANQYGNITITNGLLKVKSGGQFENWRNRTVNVATLGRIEVDSGAALRNNGTITLNSGQPLINNGELSGTGTIVGSLTNNGTLRPGNSPGAMTILGDYTENSFLQIELGGLNAFVPEYDYIDVIGNVSLGSTSLLGLDFFGTFNEASLSNGDYFDIIRYTGVFDGLFGNIDYTGAQLTSGLWSLDYGFDFAVGGIKSVRLSYAYTGEGVDGNTSPVPEPSTLLLLGSGLMGLRFIRRRFKA